MSRREVRFVYYRLNDKRILTLLQVAADITGVEVPIARIFFSLGMHRGRLLAYLISDPELSLQSILITATIIGRFRAWVDVGWVSRFSTLVGLIYRTWVNGASLWLVDVYSGAFLALLAGGHWLMERRNQLKRNRSPSDQPANRMGIGVQHAGDWIDSLPFERSEITSGNQIRLGHNPKASHTLPLRANQDLLPTALENKDDLLGGKAVRVGCER